jgi:outer membrane protein TolC
MTMKHGILVIALLTSSLGRAEEVVVAEAAPEPSAPAASEAPQARDLLKDTSDEMVKSMEGIAEYLETIAATEEAEARSAAEPLKLTAPAAVELALTQTDRVFVAEADLEAAQAQVGQARSALFPQARASSAYVHMEYNDPPGVNVPPWMTLLELAGSSSAVEALLTLLTSSQTDLGPGDTIRQDVVTVSQVFYTGGQLRAAIRASEYLAQAQEWQRVATLAELEFEAKRAYYDCLLAQALVRVAEGSVTTFEQNLSDAEQMLDVGMISNFEVLRAKTELGAREADVITARNQASIAVATLLRVLNLPQHTPVEVEPRMEWLPYVAPVDELTAYAGEHLPEILALRETINAAEQAVRGVRGQYHPQVAGNAQYSNTDRGGPLTPDGWTFSIGAEWEIMAGGRRRYEKALAKAQLSSLEHQLDDVERQVELSITQARISILNAMAKTESERGNVELAQEGLRLAELRFQEGVGTQSEVLEADLALTSAQTNLVVALYEYAVANAALERAIGKSWMKPEEDLPDSPDEASSEDSSE